MLYRDTGNPFKLDFKADKAAQKIQEVERNETISDYTTQNSLKCFEGGEIKVRSG